MISYYDYHNDIAITEIHVGKFSMSLLVLMLIYIYFYTAVCYQSGLTIMYYYFTKSCVFLFSIV